MYKKVKLSPHEMKLALKYSLELGKLFPLQIWYSTISHNNLLRRSKHICLKDLNWYNCKPVVMLHHSKNISLHRQWSGNKEKLTILLQIIRTHSAQEKAFLFESWLCWNWTVMLSEIYCYNPSLVSFKAVYPSCWQITQATMAS